MAWRYIAAVCLASVSIAHAAPPEISAPLGFELGKATCTDILAKEAKLGHSPKLLQQTAPQIANPPYAVKTYAIPNLSGYGEAEATFAGMTCDRAGMVSTLMLAFGSRSDPDYLQLMRGLMPSLSRKYELLGNLGKTSNGTVSALWKTGNGYALALYTRDSPTTYILGITYYAPHVWAEAEPVVKRRLGIAH